MTSNGFVLQRGFKALTIAAWLLLVGGRLLLALQAADLGDGAPLAAFSFAVVLPASAVLLLLGLPAARTLEGILMRVGTLLQLLLLLALPTLSLHLLLGLPLVFLLVELFVTRVPEQWRQPVQQCVLKRAWN
ncbi:MAG: hypothetical protein ABWY06_01745 [Pseudomonas sp.]|uniref:hypothetical protein n=1 Tax=Pseudomonas sp. TaxID=306 RepID=UPI00339909BA